MSRWSDSTALRPVGRPAGQSTGRPVERPAVRSARRPAKRPTERPAKSRQHRRRSWLRRRCWRGSAEGQVRRSANERAQVEPLAALVAVFAVGVALTTYAGVLDATLPTPDRNLAEPTVERVERAISEAGVVGPTSLATGLRAGPEGYRMNLTLVAADRTWHAGPTPPPNVATPSSRIDAPSQSAGAGASDTAEIAVSVRLAPGQIRPGRLHAVVWR